MEDLNPLIRQRIEKYEQLKQESGVKHFPNTYRKDTDVAVFIESYKERSTEELHEISTVHHFAGRIMAARKFGNASFIHFQDGSGRLQAFFEEARLGKEAYDLFKKLDIGDIIGLWGYTRQKPGQASSASMYQGSNCSPNRFQTPAGEVARAERCRDQYRQRYVDLLSPPR